MPTIEFTFGVGTAQFRQRLHEMGEGIMGDNRPMREVNKRPRVTEPERPVQIIRRHDAGQRLPVVHVMVPNMFGRREPLLDGETGQPVDFMAEFGDPYEWERDRGGEATQAAQRAAKMCLTILKARTP